MLMSQFLNDLMTGTNLGATISGFGALASWTALLVAEVRRRQALLTDLDRVNAEVSASRGAFWTPLREAYARFKASQPSAPEELHTLILRAGMPDDVLLRRGRPLLQWPAEHADSLDHDQSLLWKFATLVYPSRQGRQGDVYGYSFIAAPFAQSFHETRGKLARFWHSWAKSLPARKIAAHHKSEHLDFLILTWLDIALKQWTPEDRDVGKTPLYRLAAESIRR